MINNFRNTLIRKSYKIYDRYLKQTQIGNFLAKKVVDIGLISRTELQIARLLPSDKETPNSFEYSKYAQEINSVELPSFHLSPPLNFELSDQLSTVSYINVLLPSLRVKHMSGGPNTALLFAILLAERGEHIRLISCDSSANGEESALYSHMDSLVKRPVLREKIELVDAFDRSKKVYIGKSDIFFATAWWTAQIAKYGTEKTIHKTFVYLIQDFEPILHEGSTFQARALETYSLPHIPLINTNLLLEHLVQEKAGYYANPDFASKALAFEPALDRNYYFPDGIASPTKNDKKVLLFYARPTVARRNLFEIGIVALRQAVASGAISSEQWEVWAMGEKLPPISLGNGVYLNPLPWLSFEDYAKRVRTADLLLSLMLSPHPSYPPLEMAASGNLVVTNSFSVKTADRMKEFSPNIIVAEPTPQSIGLALERAVGRINAGLPSYDPAGIINLPTDWEYSLQRTIPELMNRLILLRSTPHGEDKKSLASGSPTYPKTTYEVYRKNRLERRRQLKNYKQQTGLLSFVTSAYNTPPQFLLELGSSLFLQDGGTNFEWLILDNGSTSSQTIHALAYLSKYPNVRLERVEKNLGIIGGMRYLLENAQGRYILPLDSDDLLELDCVNVLTSYICENDYPPLLYTDEDKVSESSFHTPYLKPDWDPVLFLHSCYIAHLCAIDREKALALDLYTDRTAEGCHDWDSFIRFMNAGYTPCHVPEILYSWRIHEASTSGNITSKSYITESHRATLQRFLDSRSVQDIELTLSPLFSYGVDWWFKHKRSEYISCETIILPKNGLNLLELATTLDQTDSEFVNLRWEGIEPDNDEWLWEASALMKIFPDTVMIGGSLHDGKSILAAPIVFGFENGFGSPDVGRTLSDPGYFAWLYKTRSVSALPLGHCVINRLFLIEAIKIMASESALCAYALGIWLSALASESGKRVIFTPFMGAKASWVAERRIPVEFRTFLISRFWHLIPEERFYSSQLGLSQQTAYKPVLEHTRISHLRSLQADTLPYSKWLDWQLLTRIKNYPVVEDSIGITLITTVYERTDAELLDALGSSIMTQTVKPLEWIIVAHGPIPQAVLERVRGKAKDWSATLIIEPEPLGIARAMRLALDSAKGDYIVPIDADDLITSDAVQIILHYISKFDRPDFLYSDEDLLIDGQPTAPYLRSDFDPVLNLDSSYVWHLCAIKRQSAFENSLYSDVQMNWCHDWDSISKIRNAAGKIVHIPEVLYHWRRHPESTTNNSQGDSRSLESVRYVLERQIALNASPDKFYVADWPIDRGAKELYIARKTGDMPHFLWLYDSLADLTEPVGADSILVVTSKSVLIDVSTTYLEVARLFELHPDLGAVGGLTSNEDGLVVDSCYVTNGAGALESPWIGKSIGYSGPYALALKSQTVSMTGCTLAFFRVSALMEAECWPLEMSGFLSVVVTEACQSILKKQWRIGFSPLVRGFTTAQLESESLSGVRILKYSSPPSMMSRYGVMRNFRG